MPKSIKNIANKSWIPQNVFCGYIPMSANTNDSIGALVSDRDVSHMLLN